MRVTLRFWGWEDGYLGGSRRKAHVWRNLGRRQQLWTSTRRRCIPGSGCWVLRLEALSRTCGPQPRGKRGAILGSQEGIPGLQKWKDPGTDLDTGELILNKTKPTYLTCSLILKSPLTGHRNHMGTSWLCSQWGSRSQILSWRQILIRLESGSQRMEKREKKNGALALKTVGFLFICAVLL